MADTRRHYTTALDAAEDAVNYEICPGEGWDIRPVECPDGVTRYVLAGPYGISIRENGTVS